MNSAIVCKLIQTCVVCVCVCVCIKGIKWDVLSKGWISMDTTALTHIPGLCDRDYVCVCMLSPSWGFTWKSIKLMLKPYICWLSVCVYIHVYLIYVFPNSCVCVYMYIYIHTCIYVHSPDLPASQMYVCTLSIMYAMVCTCTYIRSKQICIVSDIGTLSPTGRYIHVYTCVVYCKSISLQIQELSNTLLLQPNSVSAHL